MVCCLKNGSNSITLLTLLPKMIDNDEADLIALATDKIIRGKDLDKLINNSHNIN